ncbi:hypothetical protein [uncultured Maricaulis sp.]|uniref:hypothetical protein n=1 Tax=uncultured Maricaulis sp. TaxID=174710 RepID=UPI00262FAE5E|nr:hypothetical protein [uncultured Maricaulis sp.]
MNTSDNSRLARPPERQSAGLGAEVLHRFDGLIKLRLGHAAFGSTLLPEILFIEFGSKWRFYQPSFFSPAILVFNKEPGIHVAQISVDVGGPRESKLTRLVLELRSDGFVRSHDDGAQLYRCEVKGPRRLARHASGQCWRRADDDYDVLLFHITSPEAFSGIVTSGELRSSRWNLQGTRELANVAYVYLTNLPSIEAEEDLRRIAMSSNGVIHFQTTPYRALEETLELEVYRENTAGRTTKLQVKVASDLLAPPHLLIHRPIGDQAYYEVIGPEIYRVGVQPGVALEFARGRATVDAVKLKRFGYVVVGDASTVEGLAAPYDEEESKEVVHVEKLDAGLDLFEYWLNHQNSDQISSRHPEPRILSG